MLSIEVCRKHLGKSQSEMNDAEVEEIRDTLYQVANVLVNSYVERKAKND